ncbi:hypothetical protein JHK87_045031 [Glycine soja]|nr:hypothetical protein JHK87_045031 [Glycine soja]
MPMELELELGSTTIQRSFDARYTRHTRDLLDELPDSFTVTDPSILGHPIVFASPGFLKLTGYSLREVLALWDAEVEREELCEASDDEK